MSDDRKPASEETRRKIIEALEKGNVEMSDHGKEYFARAGGISLRKPDFTVVKVTAEFWGPWHRTDADGNTRGNQGGVELSWQTVSAGFGGLTVCLADDGTIRADTECMKPAFCREVLAKLDEASRDRVSVFFNCPCDELPDRWVARD